MDLAERLGRVTAPELAPVVRQGLRDEAAWPLSWDIESMSWAAVNPATIALYRLTGRASTGSGEELTWAVVLKVVNDVDLAGTPLDVGFLHDPQDWNYWKREAVAFRSGLLTGWPGPLVPVRCLGVHDTAEDGTWVWLEACDAVPSRSTWTLEEQAVLAYDLGAFSAQWSADPPSPVDHPWLAQRWLRGGMASLRAGGADHALNHDGCWAHPLLAVALPRGTQQRARRLFDGAADGEAIARIEASDEAVTILAGEAVLAVGSRAEGGGPVWASIGPRSGCDASNSSVLRIDASTSKITGRVSVPCAAYAVQIGDNLWVVDDDSEALYVAAVTG